MIRITVIPQGEIGRTWEYKVTKDGESVYSARATIIDSHYLLSESDIIVGGGFNPIGIEDIHKVEVANTRLKDRARKRAKFELEQTVEIVDFTE